jgi:hypothetical protein
MPAICPDGHPSGTDDYCDQCGTPMHPANADPSGSVQLDPGVGARAERLSETTIEPAALPETAAKVCTNCDSPAARDDKFCEVCGYDFVTGNTVRAAASGSVPDDALAPTSDVGAPARGWRLIVGADRGHYDRMRPDGISFPAAFAQRVFELCGDVVVVGRGDDRGPGPDIDLAGEPEDVAVSRRHLLLERAGDGSYTLLDPGSTNGTLVNEAEQPLPLGHRIVLKDRDRLFIGAWTRIEVRTG